MNINRVFHPKHQKRVACLLALALAVWGGQAIAADDTMQPASGMQHMHAGMLSMNMAHETKDDMNHSGMHDMQDMQGPMSAEMHAHHMQMMQRQGYERSIHEYIAPDLTLVDMNGETISLHSALDTKQPVMMNFIFTTCTTICPVLTATFSQVEHELGSEAQQVRMISITIDPEQDTPQQLKTYAERYDAGSHWQFLTGERNDIVAMQKAFDIYRGSKSNHEPITLLRGAGKSSWVRIDGIASASDIIGEYHALASVAK
jgi:protein SCO1